MQPLHGKQALTYDDINLIPQYSDIESRSQIDLTTQLTTNYKIKVPLIASPMDTVCDSEMAIAMMELGGVGCIHRFMSIEDQAAEVSKVHSFRFKEKSIPIMAAVGANGDYFERTEALVNAGVNVILIDVAHGHHAFVREALIKIKDKIGRAHV